MSIESSQAILGRIIEDTKIIVDRATHKMLAKKSDKSATTEEKAAARAEFKRASDLRAATIGYASAFTAEDEPAVDDSSESEGVPL